MLNWASRFNICILLDSQACPEGQKNFECLLAVGSSEELSVPAGSGLDPLAALQEFSRLQDDWLFGHIGYDLKSESNPFPSSLPDPIGFPDLFFFVPEIVIELVQDRIRIGMRGNGQAAIFRSLFETGERNELNRELGLQAMEPLQARFTREEYIQTIESLREHIQRGDCYEINFCMEFFARNVVMDPLTVYLALSEVSPAPFSAFYRLNDRYLLCASPERYLANKGNRLLSQPIKGTSPRDLKNPVQDRLNKEHLYHSKKDRTENVMIVDLVRNDLSRVCLPGSVRVDELFGIYSFRQVHQMISTVSGERAPGKSFVDCIRETFPMGSMTGAPKRRVMELIAQYERSRRGLFSGAVGYVLPAADDTAPAGEDSAGVDKPARTSGDLEKGSRDFDFNVVIRSLFYNSSNGCLSYQVGSGITINSDPQKEYEECLLKAAGIRQALGLKIRD